MGIDKKTPLAELMRPEKLEDIIGQEAILSKGSPLRTMIETDNYRSFILWGPPGSGKTTIAKLIQKQTKHKFVSYSAVISGIKEIKKMMQEAEYLFKTNNISTILFVDEIHRFNKSQQDAFLPYVEAGYIVLIGATTENPSFEVISALLSRTQVFVLKSLSVNQIKTVLTKACTKLEIKSLDDNILHFIASISEGDARRALNSLEIILNETKDNKNITIETVGKILSKSSKLYDKNGEEHYNIISAFHKSIRGSDPQASLYWLARMLQAGEDAKYIARRLIRIASEDVGLADPNALSYAVACMQAVNFVGMPEADLALAQLTVYLATAPKSNSLYIAYNDAKKDADKYSALPVPLHIRNAPTKLMKDLGYSNGYKYPHDYPNHFVFQRYFPENMRPAVYYKPGNFGFEKEILKRIVWFEKLKKNKKD